jgi:hypothetical protein
MHMTDNLGRAHRAGDSLRYWIHWLATADNRCLEMSPTYLDMGNQIVLDYFKTHPEIARKPRREP